MDDPRNKRVTVAGLGRFGGSIAAAQWLCQQGAKVLVTDSSPADKLTASIKQLDGYPIDFRLGEHRTDDFTACDLIVASPAIPPANPYLQAARQAGVPVTTEIRLFLESCPLPVIAVSGTKGKSTTSKLLTLMLQTRYTCWLGGNIGKSLLHDLPKMKSGEIVLLELSSFMLEYLGEIHWRPDVAVLTMLGEDHLEWHVTAEAYQAAKRKLIEFQRESDHAVLGTACPIAREFAKHTRAKVIWYGVEGAKRFALKIPGEHNQLNAQAAFAAANCMGVSWDAAQSAIRDFTGLPHRLQLVHEGRGVRFFNDSIATIPQAAAAALRSFARGKVIQIVGGHDKKIPFDVMCEAIADHAKAAICIGESRRVISDCMQRCRPGFRGLECIEKIDGAMGRAREIASAGDVVLLSTGCSSYDQFDNFEQRGERFAALAKELFVD